MALRGVYKITGIVDNPVVCHLYRLQLAAFGKPLKIIIVKIRFTPPPSILTNNHCIKSVSNFGGLFKDFAHWSWILDFSPKAPFFPVVTTRE